MEDYKVWALLNVCVEQGRIAETERINYTRLALADYPTTLAVLAGLPTPAASATETAKWDFDRLRKEAPAVLLNMQANEPNRYEALKELYTAALKLKRTMRMPPQPRPLVSDDDKKNWDFERLRKEAPAMLEKIRKEDPARYERMKTKHVAFLKGK